MKISVIIPARDLRGVIGRCLDSIAAQDLDRSEYEVLVVFDSCTDDTAKVVEAWRAAHADVNVRTFVTDCGTPGGARNVGLDNASGEYIMFVDGDDYLINDSAMTILLDAVKGHNAVRMTDHELSGGEISFADRLTVWLHFFSRELIGQERFTDLILCEDYEFVKRITLKPEYDAATVDVPLYHYNYDDERMTARIFEAFKLTRERKANGLSPAFVLDDFTPKRSGDV